jgi:hypothetical protein
MVVAGALKRRCRTELSLPHMGERIENSFRGVIVMGIALFAVAFAGALLLLARGSVLDGVIVAVVTYLLFKWFWRATLRKRELIRRGFFTGMRVGTNWVYQELHAGEVVSLELPLEYVGRGEYDIHVPGEGDWLAAMPDWAKSRRAEIVERLQLVFKRSQIHFGPDAR